MKRVDSEMSAWERFFFRPVDTRFIAAFRIGFAAILLANCLAYLPFAQMWWGASGALPFDVARSLIDPDTLTIFTWLPRGDTTLWVCFTIFLIQVVALLVGYKSRIQAICVFVWLISFQHRLHLINDGEDTVFRLFCFLLIFLPLGQAFSLDARLRREPSALAQPAWALRLVQFQTALVVFCAGWEKWRGAEWVDGTAMYYVSRLDDLYGRFPMPSAVLDSLPALQAMTWASLGFETLAPLLIWFRPTRVPTIIAAVSFHWMIDYTMNLFLFQWLMILGWLSFLATTDLELWRKVLPGWTPMKS